MIIDCHLHHMPSPLNNDYVRWLNETGDKRFGPGYLWDKPAFEDTIHMLEKMNSAGVDISVVTYSANMTAILELAATKGGEAEAIRWMNDRMIEKKKETGGRLLPTAWIDPRLGQAAIAEMGRAVAAVAVGFSILTAYRQDGALKFVDHPEFEPFWAKAAEYGLPVFIHFSSQFSTGQREYLEGYMAYTLLHAGMEQLMEDTVCAARLVLSGLFDRHPGLKVVLGQLGGLFPFMMERFDMLYTMYAMGAKKSGLDVTDKGDPKGFLRKLSDYRENLYLDTHSMDRQSILAAYELVGPGHVLYGSDYPITPDVWGRDRGIALIRNLEADEAVKTDILGGAAKQLLGL